MVSTTDWSVSANLVEFNSSMTVLVNEIPVATAIAGKSFCSNPSILSNDFLNRGQYASGGRDYRVGLHERQLLLLKLL